MWYRTFDNIVDDFFSTANSIDTFNLPKYMPKANVKETETGFDIKVAVPGIESKDLSVEVDANKNTLYIEYDGEGNEFVQAFKRTYEVPQIIDLDTIQVEVELGVLTVTMTRKEEASRKKIL